ncbi:uncharacterized protein LOC141858538 [Brevipalpus obovatus]|uniref:uncharacterized protein LOC141858538 n=1 Tax=Brevipalpus obovatus TaxID=246614 RepID=UPI003D9ED4D8
MSSISILPSPEVRSRLYHEISSSFICRILLGTYSRITPICVRILLFLCLMVKLNECWMNLKYFIASFDTKSDHASRSLSYFADLTMELWFVGGSFTGLLFRIEKFYRTFDAVWMELPISYGTMMSRLLEASRKNTRHKMWRLIFVSSIIVSYDLRATIEKGLQSRTLFLRGILNFLVNLLELIIEFEILRTLLVSTSLISSGFKCIKTQMKTLKSPDDLTPEKLEHYRTCYDGLKKLVNLTNNTFSLYISMTLTIFVPNSIAVFYNMIFSPLTVEIYIFNAILTAYNFNLLSIMIAPLIKVYSSASSPYLPLYRIILGHSSNALKIEASMFLDQLGANKIGFRYLGAYYITPEIGVSLATLVVTYLLGLSALIG